MFYRRTPRIPGNQSIAELRRVEINGVPQTLLLRGENRNNPIMLFLHGGPGTTQIAFARRYMQDLERDFIVVNWDQRGAGLSYSRKVKPESMKIDQFVEDTRAISQMLLKEFGHGKLFLVGHSWGSLIGTLTAARYPELFHAYVGMGQIASMIDNETYSYRFVLEAARASGNAKAMRELERIGPPPYRSMSDMGVQRRWLGRFGGFIRRGSVGKLVREMLLSPEYTLVDSVRFALGQRFSLMTLWPEVMTTNLPAQAPRLRVPVYYILGRYDQNCPTELATAYFERLRAPVKQLFWFENSAHLLWGEEPAEFTRVMRKVLADYRSQAPAARRARA